MEWSKYSASAVGSSWVISANVGEMFHRNVPVTGERPIVGCSSTNRCLYQPSASTVAKALRAIVSAVCRSASRPDAGRSDARY